MILKPFYVLKKRIRFEKIIVIEEARPITLRERETTIRGRGNSASFFVLGKDDP
jgi:hypothetical protein